MWWIIGIVCVGPLIYLAVSSRDARLEREAKLKRIRRRLAELKDAASEDRQSDQS